MLQGNIKLRLSLSWNETPVRERHNASAETQYFKISCHESAERTKTSASSEKGAARLFTSDLWFEGFNLGSESRDFFLPFQQLLHCFCRKITAMRHLAHTTRRWSKSVQWFVTGVPQSFPQFCVNSLSVTWQDTVKSYEVIGQTPLCTRRAAIFSSFLAIRRLSEIYVTRQRLVRSLFIGCDSGNLFYFTKTYA